MRKTYRVLLVQSDPALAATLANFLEGEGYLVTRSSDGVEGLSRVRHVHADLIILDGELDGIDGITLCGMIRSQASTPLILFTTGDDKLQQVVGLDRGADLCMGKPVSLAELRARIRALLRRADQMAARGSQAISIGALRIDIQMRRTWLLGQALHLTPKEFELLAYLMLHCGRALSRDQLLKQVWNGRVNSASQTLEVHIRWLRRKIEPDPDHPVYIRTVRMVGYRFEGP